MWEFEKFILTWRSLPFIMTVLDYTPQVQEELQIFSVLVSLSWITHHILTIWQYWIFICLQN
jgi:hypothetical protein